jgi:hypothetical protein
MSYGTRHADLLFEIINRHYERKPTLITTLQILCLGSPLVVVFQQPARPCPFPDTFRCVGCVELYRRSNFPLAECPSA